MKARVEMAAVVKSYGAQRVLDRAWLQVNAGEAVGLIGDNGAGKTTLLRIAAGLVIHDHGLVRVLKNGSQPLVRYFGGERTLPPAVTGSRWARWFGVSTVAESRPLGQLSRGSRQLLGLRAVLGGPDVDVILLDEPWEGLDPNGAAWLTETVLRHRARGAALLLSSHRLHDLSDACTRFVHLKDGRCIEMEPEAGMTRIDQLTEVFTRR
jgi:ABC-2 type transport system ATP-binding protein